jgi:hypothetical protein
MEARDRNVRGGRRGSPGPRSRRFPGRFRRRPLRRRRCPRRLRGRPELVRCGAHRGAAGYSFLREALPSRRLLRARAALHRVGSVGRPHACPRPGRRRVRRSGRAWNPGSGCTPPRPSGRSNPRDRGGEDRVSGSGVRTAGDARHQQEPALRHVARNRSGRCRQTRAADARPASDSDVARADRSPGARPCRAECVTGG